MHRKIVVGEANTVLGAILTRALLPPLRLLPRPFEILRIALRPCLSPAVLVGSHSPLRTRSMCLIKERLLHPPLALLLRVLKTDRNTPATHQPVIRMILLHSGRSFRIIWAIWAGRG